MPDPGGAHEGMALSAGRRAPQATRARVPRRQARHGRHSPGTPPPHPPPHRGMCPTRVLTTVVCPAYLSWSGVTDGVRAVP